MYLLEHRQPVQLQAKGKGSQLSHYKVHLRTAWEVPPKSSKPFRCCCSNTSNNREVSPASLLSFLPNFETFLLILLVYVASLSCYFIYIWFVLFCVCLWGYSTSQVWGGSVNVSACVCIVHCVFCVLCSSVI